MCDQKKCEEFVKSLNGSPKIKALLEGISGPAPVIGCRPCAKTGPEGNARAALFDSDPLEIVLCINRLQESDLEEALTHELVHAYDYSNRRCDFGGCEGLAYTEIRAARYSECKGPFLFDWMRQKCIKDHAVSSTKNFFANAQKCVDNVYPKAMLDESPMAEPAPTPTSK
jgi:hypothetical protein